MRVLFGFTYARLGAFKWEQLENSQVMIATTASDGGAIRFKHDFGTSGSELLSEAIQYFYCRDIFERVALGRRPMSENASKVLQ